MSPESHSLAVSCRGITKWFGEHDTRVHVLRGLDLDIDLGELAMLVGPTGCGKTTLISVITGLLEADDGDLMVLGQRQSHMTTAAQTLFRQAHVGFVFQQ